MDIDYRMMGKRIQKLRKSQNLTQEQLSEMTNISVQYMSNIERSHSIPSLETVMSLCRALNVTPNDILLGVDSASEDYLTGEILSRFQQCTPSDKRLIYGIMELLKQEREKK